MIKIDVITGFLGAGKTTFIKGLLDSGSLEGEKVIIIENEFGEIPIDNRILENQSYDLIEISGGCICCSLKGNVIEALADIALNEKPNRVLMEPSGVFMVKDLRTILQDPGVRGNYILNGIYTLIDCKHFMMDRMRQAPFFVSQLVYGSQLIISKADEIDPVTLDNLLGHLRSYNSFGEIHGVALQSMDALYLKEMLAKGYDDGCLDIEDWDDKTTDDHKGMIAIGLSELRSFERSSFDNLIDKVKVGAYGQIIRMKGYVRIAGVRYLINYVSGDIFFEEASEGPCMMTVIGYTLDSLALRRRMAKIAGVPSN